MIIEDDQVHSKASDGNWRPSKVVHEAKKRGLKAIALTDHDTTYGVPEALEVGKGIGVKVHPGIEIASMYNEGRFNLRRLEILGLRISLPLVRSFEGYLEDQRRGALSNFVSKFNRYINSSQFGSDNPHKKYPLRNPKEIGVEDLIRWKCARDDYYNPAPYISDWELAFYIFGHFAPHLDLERKTFDRERSVMNWIMNEYAFLFEQPANRPSHANVIREIKKSGGIAIWAHPGRSECYGEKALVREWQSDKRDWFSERRAHTPFTLAKSLVRVGLDGIELYYYEGNDETHAGMQTRINRYFELMAKNLGLMVTFGSDCHGPRLREPFMGLFGSRNFIL